MTYPFEFRELRITDRVLDKLQFTEYWAGCGDFGERCFGESLNEHQFKGEVYRIVEEDEKDDDCDGYGSGPAYYVAQYFHSSFKSKEHRDIYFLHDLYEDIKANTPTLVDLFIERCKAVNMYPFIKSYLEYISKTA